MTTDIIERLWQSATQDSAPSKALAVEAADEIERLRAALTGVVSDVLEYEKINKLAPSPGRKFCWDSVARACAILGENR